MLFKNLRVYRFTKPFDLNPEELHEKLQEQAFVPCGKQQPMRMGWVPPLGKHGSELSHAANGYIMLCSKREERVLPASVVNEEVAQRAEALELEEDRKVGRKERQTLKDDVIFSLLPRAFTRSSLQYGYIDPRLGVLVIDTGSAKRAEEFMVELREALGKLPVIPFASRNTPQQAMTHWMTSARPPAEFELGNECQLQDLSDESGVIQCRHQDLYAEEIANHLKAGMAVTRLGLSWEHGIDCVVDVDLAIKKLKFTDIVQEKLDAHDPDGAAEQFDNDFSIMTLELTAFLKALLEAFGGEAPQDNKAEPDASALAQKSEAVPA